MSEEKAEEKEQDVKVTVHRERIEDMTLDEYATLQDFGEPGSTVLVREFIGLLDRLVTIEIDGEPVPAGRLRGGQLEPVLETITETVKELASSKN